MENSIHFIDIERCGNPDSIKAPIQDALQGSQKADIPHCIATAARHERWRDESQRLNGYVATVFDDMLYVHVAVKDYKSALSLTPFPQHRGLA